VGALTASATLEAMLTPAPQEGQVNSICRCALISPTRMMCGVPQEGQWILLPWLDMTREGAVLPFVPPHPSAEAVV
jgi:hypothetical protein